MVQLFTEVLDLNKKYTKEELINLLTGLCDNDFNGNNGKEYYNYSDSMSDLEYFIEKTMKEHNRLTDIITTILDENYYMNLYYSSYKLNLKEVDGKLFLSLVIVS